MKKKLTCLLVLIVFLFSGCTNGANNNTEGNQTVEPQTQDTQMENSSGVIISEEEYELFQSLKEEKEFASSYDYYLIQVMSWKFAKACLSNDTETMKAFATEDMEIDVTMDIFADNLVFLIVKNIQQHPNGKIIVSCEFAQKDEDSLTYLTTEVDKINEEWKVVWYGFEK